MLRDDLAIILKKFRYTAQKETDEAFAGKAGQELLEFLSKRLSRITKKPGIKAGILESQFTRGDQ